jgi:hypothetical protein
VSVIDIAPVEYAGACHCGALRVRYRTALLPRDWQIRACQCSFCRAHAALTTSDPEGELVLSGREPLLQRYRFGSGTTEFWICRQCGVYVSATMDGRGVLNVHCLRPISADTCVPIPMQYGEESVERKRERRAARWTPLRSTEA